MTKTGWVVELERGVWLTCAPVNWRVDRTLCHAHAKQYTSERAAKSALARARRIYPFLDAKIYASAETK